MAMFEQIIDLMVMVNYPMVVMVSTLKSKAEGKSKTPVTHWRKRQNGKGREQLFTFLA